MVRRRVRITVVVISRRRWVWDLCLRVWSSDCVRRTLLSSGSQEVSDESSLDMAEYFWNGSLKNWNL